MALDLLPLAIIFCKVGCQLKTPGNNNPPQQSAKYRRFKLLGATTIVSCILIAGIVFGVFTFNRIEARNLEWKVIRNLYRIYDGEENFKVIRGRYGTLKELAEANLIDPSFAGDQNEFKYRYWISDLSPSTFCLHADRKSLIPSNKDFNMSEDGITRFIRSWNLGSVQRGQGEKVFEGVN